MVWRSLNRNRTNEKCPNCRDIRDSVAITNVSGNGIGADRFSIWLFFRLGLLLKKSSLLTWGLAKELILCSEAAPSVLGLFTCARVRGGKNMENLEMFSTTVMSSVS